VKVPDGLAFSEFKGYETWQDVAVSQTETSLKVIAANTPMINAYRQGVPGNHKLFPEGSKIVKIEWSTKGHVIAAHWNLSSCSPKLSGSDPLLGNLTLSPAKQMADQIALIRHPVFCR
jgi:hypothetical protein